jgi:hypothetical protein
VNLVEAGQVWRGDDGFDLQPAPARRHHRVRRMARARGEEDEAARVAAVVERVEGRGAERVRVERD